MLNSKNSLLLFPYLKTEDGRINSLKLVNHLYLEPSLKSSSPIPISPISDPIVSRVSIEAKPVIITISSASLSDVYLFWNDNPVNYKNWLQRILHLGNREGNHACSRPFLLGLIWHFGIIHYDTCNRLAVGNLLIARTWKASAALGMEFLAGESYPISTLSMLRGKERAVSWSTWVEGGSDRESGEVS